MQLPPLICPDCRTPLEPGGDTATCSSCGKTYAKDEHWDFAPELEFADIETLCDVEEQGERLRAERFYLPLLRELADEAGKPLTELRVLDDGCGFGAGVEYLRSQGIDAVGVDVGWRSQEWSRRDPPWPYVRADGRALPFVDASFEAVVSFGVIEHVGIAGESGVSEEVAPDYEEQRARYVSEALRVLRNPGVAIRRSRTAAVPSTSGTTRGARRHAGTARGSRSCPASASSRAGPRAPTAACVWTRSRRIACSPSSAYGRGGTGGSSQGSCARGLQCCGCHRCGSWRVVR